MSDDFGVELVYWRDPLLASAWVSMMIKMLGGRPFWIALSINAMIGSRLRL
jgi:hypothetical protein